MQKNYVYFRTKPMGRAFRPGFMPELTPKQMLELGVFGGKYMTDCRKEFPGSWFKRAKLSPDRPRASLNHFGVNASQSLTEWRRKGWIHPEDPRHRGDARRDYPRVPGRRLDSARDRPRGWCGYRDRRPVDATHLFDAAAGAGIDDVVGGPAQPADCL